MRTSALALALALSSTVPALGQDVHRTMDPDPELQSWTDGVVSGLTDNPMHKEAADWAGEVAPQEAGRPPEAADANSNAPIADWQSVDIDAMTRRYGLNMEDVGRDAGAVPPLLVFISFSMDEDYLSALSREVRSAGGALVLRGLINGSMPETVAKLYELAGEDVGAMLDPTLFERYSVTKVPTFVTTQQPETVCLDEECARTPPPHDRIAGNVSLRYALEALASRGEDATEIAARHLALLGGAE